MLLGYLTPYPFSTPRAPEARLAGLAVRVVRGAAPFNLYPLFSVSASFTVILTPNNLFIHILGLAFFILCQDVLFCLDDERVRG